MKDLRKILNPRKEEEIYLITIRGHTKQDVEKFVTTAGCSNLLHSGKKSSFSSPYSPVQGLAYDNVTQKQWEIARPLLTGWGAIPVPAQSTNQHTQEKGERTRIIVWLPKTNKVKLELHCWSKSTIADFMSTREKLITMPNKGNKRVDWNTMHEGQRLYKRYYILNSGDADMLIQQAIQQGATMEEPYIQSGLPIEFVHARWSVVNLPTTLS